MKMPPFMPPAGLSNPHVQTILYSIGRKLRPQKSDLHTTTRRQIFTVNGVQLAVDLNITAGQPLIILIPGWLGDSQSTYIISAATALDEKNFSTARINLRDHGKTTHLNAGLFNSAQHDEVIALVDQLSVEYGGAGSGLIGFSLGGNFALRVARARPELKTLAICPAISPASTMQKIDRSPIYQHYFVRKWRSVWTDKQSAFPQRYNFAEALKLTTVSALTDYFVRYHSDFDSTSAYFAAYDLSQSALAGVTAHILAAADDPIIPASHYQDLPDSLAVTLTQQGGHGAYLDSWRLTSWADSYATNFFSTLS